MRLCDLVLSLISLIGCFSMLSTTVESQELASKISSKPISMVWNIHLQDLSDRWRMAYPELQTPRTETHAPKEKKLLDKWESADNFEYIDKKLGTAMKMKSAANEGDKSEVREHIATRKEFFPLLNIIKEPTYCPEGERMDSNGVCRPVIQTDGS